MGTNYYARILPSQEKKSHLKKLIDEDKFNEIQDEVQEMYGESTEFCNGSEIHLGKRSAGWKFLFNPNYEKYYSLTKEGLRNFLSRKDVIIYDEYFNPSNDPPEYTDDPDSINNKHEYLWTADQFLDMALNWNNTPEKQGWTGKEYDQWEVETNKRESYYLRHGDYHEKYWKNRGYYPEYFNFINDGMRWSTCCEFS